MSSSTLDSSQPSSSPLAYHSPTAALWTHLLRKDKPGTFPKTDVLQPPAAPQDRNATSTRILLYDTQTRLEQFSAQADSMLKQMEDAAQQMKSIGLLFEKDRDTLTNDIIDLVNRSQREIEKAVGHPAQEDRLFVFQEKVDLRLEALNQRLDALQMFNQTHLQAIETQTHALKSLQEQQNAILSAILPLLPVVQAISPQIDSLKPYLHELVSPVVSGVQTLQRDLTAHPSSLFREPTNPTRKRRLSEFLHDGSPSLGRKSSSVFSKKIREEEPSSTLGTNRTSSKVDNPVPHFPLLIPRISSPRSSNPSNIKANSRPRRRSIFATPQTPQHTAGVPESALHQPFSFRIDSHARYLSPQDETATGASPGLLLGQGTNPTPQFNVDGLKSDTNGNPGELQNHLQTSATSQRNSPCKETADQSVHQVDPQIIQQEMMSDSRVQPEKSPAVTLSTAQKSRMFLTGSFVVANRTISTRSTKPMTNVRTVPAQAPDPLRQTRIYSPFHQNTILGPGSSLRINKTKERKTPMEGRRFIPLDDDDEDEEED